MRFSGSFGQPDGFDSILTAIVKEDGGLCLTLNYKCDYEERMWSIELDNEQRKVLRDHIDGYEPRLWEVIGEGA